MRDTTNNTLYTIGHSDHELPHLISILMHHHITAVADVRSHPYSRLHAQYNQDIISRMLRRNGIHYVHLGAEFGARRDELDCYVNGQAKYDLIANLPAFRKGLSRLREGIKRQTIALFCAEHDPITCHRMILICRQLRYDPIDILHILRDGSLENNHDSEIRLVKSTGDQPSHLFKSEDHIVNEAYDRQSLRIAYTLPSPETTNEAVP